MKSLTPFQVEAIEQTREVATKPAKRKRLTSLGCYIPMATKDGQQASRRITGSHLDPDSLEMEAAAVAMADSLLDAVNGGQQGHRILIGPANYSDRVLRIYCGMLIKSALGKKLPKTSSPVDPPVSPALVPYLLGGCTMTAVEKTCWRALELMDFLPEDKGMRSLNLSLSPVGFGADFRHRQYDDTLVTYTNDNEVITTPELKKHPHLSNSQNWLLGLPLKGSFGRVLLDEGAYEASSRVYINRQAPKLLAEAEALMDPQGGEMTEFAGKGRHAVSANKWTLQRAVHRVFERPWAELDLKGGGQENADHDLEVVLARCIIRSITYPFKVTAEAFVGMSLITGISLANWAEFAARDLRRRGETFISADELERAIEMVEIQPYYKCERELKNVLAELRFASDNPRKWARRLQSPNHPLWSTNGFYYVEGLDSKGFPKYKYKPFSLASD